MWPTHHMLSFITNKGACWFYNETGDYKFQGWIFTFNVKKQLKIYLFKTMLKSMSIVYLSHHCSCDSAWIILLTWLWPFDLQSGARHASEQHTLPEHSGSTQERHVYEAANHLPAVTQVRRAEYSMYKQYHTNSHASKTCWILNVQTIPYQQSRK